MFRTTKNGQKYKKKMEIRNFFPDSNSVPEKSYSYINFDFFPIRGEFRFFLDEKSITFLRFGFSIEKNGPHLGFRAGQRKSEIGANGKGPSLE